MMRRLSPLGSDVAVAGFAALTTFLTLLSWDGLADDASAFLVPLFWLSAGVAALGVALRALGTPRFVVPILQALAVGVALNRWWAPETAIGGWLPTPASVQDAVAVVQLAIETSALVPAPVPAEAVTFPPLMVASGAAVVLLADLLACTLRRAPLAGLPLLAAFTAPVSLLGGVAWMVFAAAALSFAFLLTADQAARLGQWGRNIAGPAQIVDNQPHEVRLATLWPSASRLAVVGVGLAVLAPAVIPASSWFFGSDGLGPGDGDGDVTIRNPMVDVRRDLIAGEDVPLVQVQTTDPNPAYLRLSVLDEFDGSAWRPSERNIPDTNRVQGPMPTPPGLGEEIRRTQYRSRFTLAQNFDSTWLPTPYPSASVRVNGDWRYDLRTLDLVSAVEDQRVSGLTYEAVGMSLAPEPAAMVGAPPAPQSLFVEGTAMPNTTPTWIEALAEEVTAAGQSGFERAVILQDWFREDGGFTYSLDPGSGSGFDQLERFLSEEGPDNRRGYCEQFAAAMAMMARTLGIPSRVAVGFLRPDAQGDGSWVYSSRDLHAWPELYFQGVGWIRFEPTPQTRATSVPGYTTAAIPAPDALPSPSASAIAPAPTASPEQADAARADSGSSADGAAPLWLVPVGGVLVLVALALAPRLVRVAQRRRRYDEAGEPAAAAEGCWQEVRATALDLGHGWDDGATLRRQALALVPAVTAAGGASGDRPRPLDSLEGLALLVERSRYSLAGLDPALCEVVRTHAQRVCEALVLGATPHARRRAVWLPRSLWRQIRRKAPTGRPPVGGRPMIRGEQSQGVDRVAV